MIKNQIIITSLMILTVLTMHYDQAFASVRIAGTNVTGATTNIYFTENTFDQFGVNGTGIQMDTTDYGVFRNYNFYRDSGGNLIKVSINSIDQQKANFTVLSSYTNLNANVSTTLLNRFQVGTTDLTLGSGWTWDSNKATNIGDVNANTLVVEHFFGDNPSLSYNHIRTNNFRDLTLSVLRTPTTFQLECNYDWELFGEGNWKNITSATYYTHTLQVPSTKTVYMKCYNEDQILTATSYGATNGTLTLINLTDEMGNIFGVPIPFFFVLLFAAVWTGRSAPTGIIALGAVIGIMSLLGYFTSPITGDPLITAGLWGFMVVLIIFGALLGKRYL